MTADYLKFIFPATCSAALSRRLKLVKG